MLGRADLRVEMPQGFADRRIEMGDFGGGRRREPLGPPAR
jgi:hypothetical protein